MYKLRTPGHLRGDPAPADQYFGAAGAEALQDALPPPAALHEALPLLAGAAAPPLALHEALPPAADGSVALGVAALPPPHPTAEPMSIPATAETARVFARFMGSSSPRPSWRSVSLWVSSGESAPGSVMRTRQAYPGIVVAKAIFLGGDRFVTRSPRRPA